MVLGRYVDVPARGRSAGSGGRGLLERHPIIPMTGSGAGEVIIPRTFKLANSPGHRENRRDSAVLRRGPGGARRAVRSASRAGPDRPGPRGRRRDCEAPSGRARRRTGYRCRAPWNHSSRGVRAPRRGLARSRGTGPCGPVENLADLRGGGAGQADRAGPARLDPPPWSSGWRRTRRRAGGGAAGRRSPCPGAPRWRRCPCRTGRGSSAGRAWR